MTEKCFCCGTELYSHECPFCDDERGTGKCKCKRNPDLKEAQEQAIVDSLEVTQ